MLTRWRATIYYRTDRGVVDVEHDLEELEELQAIVEAGPHWDTVSWIKIDRVNHINGEALTVEQAAKL